MDHRVAPAETGRTVASLLHEHAAVSHRIAKGIVEAGLLSVDGVAVTDPAGRVQAGQILRARFDPRAGYSPRRRKRPPATRWYRIVHEDSDLLVVEKPPGVLTVPAGPKKGKSLVERLLQAQSPAARSRGLWVVHRIDRYASGLVVVARRGDVLRNLREQLARRSVLREYLALVDGGPAASGELRSRLEEDPRTRVVHAVPVDEGRGSEAVLRYRIRERMRHASLVEVRLETGRRNQIRVQFAESGHPLVGDAVYGHRSPLIDRVALHAARLRFRHPGTGAMLEIRSDPPRDFQAAAEHLRKGARPKGEDAGSRRGRAGRG